jgi:hypothetical protein
MQILEEYDTPDSRLKFIVSQDVDGDASLERVMQIEPSGQ